MSREWGPVRTRACRRPRRVVRELANPPPLPLHFDLVHFSGPFNSWDRLPFLTRIASMGGDANYDSLHAEVSHNYFIANYGGAQGFDNEYVLTFRCRPP